MAALESTGVLEAPAEAGCARPGASDGDAGPQREAAEHGGGLLVAAGSQAAVVAALWERLSSLQRAGAQWLYGAYHGAHKSGYRGGILADGMGMGKTVQTLVLIHCLLHAQQLALHVHLDMARRVLIVVPKTLVAVWRKEWRKFLDMPDVPRVPAIFLSGDDQGGHAARVRFVTQLQSELDALVSDFPGRVVFGWLDRQQASAQHVLVWAANASNFEGSPGSVIHGGGQASHMGTHGPGVFGIITTPCTGLPPIAAVGGGALDVMDLGS